MGYPRYLTPGFQTYDPLALAEETEAIVCRGSSRKYTDFYCTGVYGGISTGYTVGCCLRCVFCWVDWSRDFPQRLGEFYTPKQVFTRLVENAKKKGVSKLRISGAEPTLGKRHLLEVLDLISNTGYLFILETNGFLFGADPSYVEELKRFNNIHVRICLKAGTPQGLEERTGAKGEFYELPFKAIRELQHWGIPLHVATMSDPRLMSRGERKALLQKLKEIGYYGYLEEESCDPYPTSVARLEKAGYHIFQP